MKYEMKPSLRALLLVALGLLIQTRAASAQVVITAGAQEIYDDNIFLENDTGTPPPIVIDDSLSDPNLNIDPPKQADGDPDSDFITNVYLGFSGAVPLSEKIKTSAEGKVGVLIFADQSDETRFTVDTVLTADSDKTLIPEPFYVNSRVAIQSRSSDITAAEGTATKQAQTLVAALGLGARDIALAQDTKFGLGYTFAYNDFLGDFTLKNKDNEELGAFKNRVEPRGSDYFTNGVDATLDKILNPQWAAGLFAGVTNYTFTNVDSNDLASKDEDDLDRTDGTAGLKTSYQISEQVSAGASAAVNLSHLKNEPDPIFVTVIDDNGETTQVLKDQDSDQVSLGYGANLNYAPEPLSLFRLAVDQSQQTDIDGDRIITRSVSLDASKAIGDRFKLGAGGRFLQFNVGDSITKPTERFEVTASIQYSLTENVALTAGWNYYNQRADEDNLRERFLFASEDYEGNRVFVGISGGLVGSKS